MPSGKRASSSSILAAPVGDVQGVGAGELEDGQADGRLAVEGAGLVVVLGAQFDAGHIAEPDDAAVGGAGRRARARRWRRADWPLARLAGAADVGCRRRSCRRRRLSAAVDWRSSAAPVAAAPLPVVPAAVPVALPPVAGRCCGHRRCSVVSAARSSPWRCRCSASRALLALEIGQR